MIRPGSSGWGRCRFAHAASQVDVRRQQTIADRGAGRELQLLRSELRCRRRAPGQFRALMAAI
jgi:hypothetical protein